jgi:hypothetical protein
MKKTLIVGGLVSLSACSSTLPVAVISSNGQVMRGTVTASLQGGSFQVAGQGRTCAGSYDSLNTSPTISMPVQCSDGKRGMVIVNRDPSGRSGNGRVRMEDGSEADFVFGKPAKAF